MTNKITLIIGLFFCSILCYGEKSIEITDRTIRIEHSQEEKLYVGFAEGDKLILNFKELDGKELKEIEIIEYPNNSRFSDYNCKKIKNKTINILKSGIFVFRFKNDSPGIRVCKIKIERVPSSDATKNFDTAVNWINKQDTTWNTYTKDVIVGYDTTYVQKTKKEPIKEELKEELIFDKNQKIESKISKDGNKSYLFFSLPQNENTTYKTTKVVSWAYWIGIDEEGIKAWEHNTKAIRNLITGSASVFLSPLGALAVGAVTDLSVPKTGQDVEYFISDQQNKELFIKNAEFKVYDKGKGVAGYKKFGDAATTQGTYYILLRNDNYMQGINANVKVIAMVQTTIYEDKKYTETVLNTRTEKRLFKEPIISSKLVPIIGQ